MGGASSVFQKRAPGGFDTIRAFACGAQGAAATGSPSIGACVREHDPGGHRRRGGVAGAGRGRLPRLSIFDWHDAHVMQAAQPNQGPITTTATSAKQPKTAVVRVLLPSHPDG